jgi:hypothetical protein
MPAVRYERVTNSKNYMDGPYCLLAKTSLEEEIRTTLKPGESLIFNASIEAYKKGKEHELTLD